MTLLLIFLSVLLGAVGQLFFKLAVAGRGSLSLFQSVWVSMGSLYFWIGLAGYGLSLALWMKILTDTELSFARPLAGAGYVVTAVLAVVFLDESISAQRWVGIFVTVLGVFLIARS